MDTECGGDFAAVMDVMFEHTPDDRLERNGGSYFSSQTRRIEPHLGVWLERRLDQLRVTHTFRLIQRREPYAIDMEKVIEAAARTGTFLEINGNPDRRDLNEMWARHAAEAGVKICLTSDGHGTDTLSNVRYAVATARRAWLTKEDVANAREWKDLQALRKRST